jgi:nucleotide-binding universal stress UspA family protein
MIKRILVPTDFSDCSINALKYATQLALKLEITELIVFNAYSAPASYADLNISYDLSDTVTKIEKEIEVDFKKLPKKIPELLKIPYKTIKKDTYLEEGVLSICLQDPVDLIIMGTQGASGIDEVVLGTNTHRIIKNQLCPVLVIPEHASFKPIKNIALSSDYKSIMAELLNPLKDIRYVFGSNLHVIHVSDKGILENEKATVAKTLENYLKDFPHQYHFIPDNYLEESLDRFGIEHDIDLLVIYPRKKGFFDRVFGKSESKSIIFHTKLPLLALSPYKKSRHE